MGYKALLILEKILMALPKKARKKFFLFLAWLGYIFVKKYRTIAMQNLDFLFLDTMRLEEKKKIVRYSFDNLALNFLHLLEMHRYSLEDLQAKVSKVENHHYVTEAHADGKAVVYVSAHYASWELGNTSLGGLSEPIIGVYKQLKNREYEKWLIERRELFGNVAMEKTNVVKRLIRNIKNGMACGILIDTNINVKEGIIVDFMGKSIRQTTVPAYLARKFNAAIIPANVSSEDGENYTLTFYKPIEVEHTEDIEADIQKATQAQADWLADLLKKEPKHWFWLHRRFKGDYPEIYTK
ncbi:MAG: lipid A biosynthesis lauroyl acyltransferase [Sulfurimonadaceae bacterium]|jgi:KDO2-lipid IV(A) lauroyltransferase|nr:lipid A biosynthesis lauroyl acyltransferase [Sulfurimonadaceae bacterium]